MNKTFKKIALLASGLVLLCFVVVVVNQTAQLVQLATTAHPTLGTVTLWTLLAAYAVLVLTPVVLFFRLPPSLPPPTCEDGPDFDRHLRQLRTRLASNPLVQGTDLADRAGVEAALQILARQVNEIVRRNASQVFLATAVSQSGRLDTFVVLAVQCRMVWQIAHIYHQRPTIRELVQLYANVAATALVAGELQDLDLGEQMEPVLSSSLGALAGAIPGLQVVSSVLVNSVVTGSANAFLTLRVGMVAKRYCGSLVIEKKGVLRRAASYEAAELLGAIVASGCAKVSKAVWQASKGKVGNAVSGVAGYARDTGSKFLSKVGLGRWPGPLG